MKYVIFISLILAGCTKPEYLKDGKNWMGLNLVKSQRNPNLRGKPPKEPHIPNGSNVLFLDFDGGVCEGTSWNVSGPIYYEHSGLTTLEQQTIRDSMAKDFALFNVYVTTDSNAYAHAAKKMQINMTTSNEWYGNNAGGVSYTGSIAWNDGTPCWGFTALMGFNVSNLRWVGSHELGHTIGLRHQASWVDCVLQDVYRPGVIMGRPYNYHATWIIGPTPNGCTDIQDDVAIIAATFGYK